MIGIAVVGFPSVLNMPKDLVMCIHIHLLHFDFCSDLPDNSEYLVYATKLVNYVRQ